MPLIYPKLLQKKVTISQFFFLKKPQVNFSIGLPAQKSTFFFLHAAAGNPDELRAKFNASLRGRVEYKVFPLLLLRLLWGKKGLEGKGEEGEEEEDAPPLPQWRSLGGAKFFSSFGLQVLSCQQSFGTKLTLKSKKKVGKSLSGENQGKDAGCMAVSPFSPG